MERTLIAWNVPNWITVLGMAAAGYGVLVLASYLLGVANGRSSAVGAAQTTAGF
jgi:hypothetical protein